MESIRINGQEWNAPQQESLRMTELIELIKASIDPDQIITGITINGKEMDESDWNSNISDYTTQILEVETDTAENYIQDRIQACPNIITQCYTQFRTSRKLFQNGDTFEANQKLSEAVVALKAFFDWYSTLMNLMTDAQKEKYNIDPQVEKIYETCKKICQNQLYQSWWALGELLENELEPELDNLENVLRANTKSKN